MRVTFLGDIMVTSTQLEMAKHRNNYDFTEMFSGVRKTLERSNYVIANLETTVCGEKLGYTRGKYSFNTPEEILSAIKFCGIDCVTTANNHCLDRGAEGLVGTIKHLQKAEIAYVGTHIVSEKSYKIIDIDGIKIGLLAFSYGTNAFDNKIYLKNNQKYMIDLFQEQELSNIFIRKIYSGGLVSRVIMKICRSLNLGQFKIPVYERKEKDGIFWKRYTDSIKLCRSDGADYIISCLHIGGQFNEKPTQLTKRICDLSLEYGVDAVIANHEHVIHGIKKNTNPGKLCIYSLGNFLTSYGIEEPPFDKLCEYSVAVNVDIQKCNCTPEYSFSIIHSFKQNGKIICAPLYDSYISADSDKKIELLNINNKLVNIVMSTKDTKYPILREYNFKEISKV